MKKVKLDIEYDGTCYHGWQYQPNAPTIQECIENAIFAVTGERTRVIGAGRTDAGVHAHGQVAHVCTRTRLSPSVLQRALNSVLPRDIVITGATEVPEDFHARKDATRKRYEYWVWNVSVPSAFYYRYCWHISWPLDVERMREAAQFFLGEHDFSSFRASDAPVGQSPVRHVYQFEIKKYADGRMLFGVEANGFLKSMVRTMVGTLVEVGSGKKHASDIPLIIHARDRRAAGMTAPSRALFLQWVSYAPEARSSLKSKSSGPSRLA